MPRARALDLFCGAGGVSVGLQRAGFEVVGVDIRPQPHYRGGTFVQADAMTYPLEGFDFIWASPPCQAHSALRACHKGRTYADLIPATRRRLEATGTPFVIENVVGSRLRHGFMLCGAAFGLGCVGEDGKRRQLRRHRLFEPSFAVLAPPCQCDGKQVVGVYGGGSTRPGVNTIRGGWSASAPQAREALGIDWMTRGELAQAIPPAYSQWIGEQAMRHLAAGRPAVVGSAR